MLPSFCPDSAPSGEKEVFTRLRDDPAAKGWIVLHSLDIADHIRSSQGEADFVVLIPQEGILVVEVKSHERVLYSEQGWWLGGRHHPRGPFKQASDALHSIRQYLEDCDLTFSVPFISIVVFNRASFSQSSPEWKPWQVVDKQSLFARPITETFLKIIRTARSFYATKNLHWMASCVEASSAKLEEIAATLRPRFEVLATPSDRRRQLDNSLRICTERQFSILDESSFNPRLLISGLAGTGKTTLAIETVRREKAQNISSVVSLFCFNKLLGKALRREFENFTNGLRVGSFHSWMLEISGIIPTDEQKSDPRFWNEVLPEQCLSQLTDPSATTGFLDLLVVDEAQDLLRDPFLDIFDLIIKGGLENGRWFFFGDFERQDIYSQGFNRIHHLVETRASFRCAVYRLTENCRNTQEISAALTLHARLKPGYTRVLREDSKHDPDIHFYNDDEEQAICVDEILERHLSQGFKARDIVLLSPYKCNPLAAKMSRLEKWRGRIRPYALAQECVCYSTIHSFKGLEVPVIIMTDIQSLDSRMDFDLLYVGMSRALHRLSILFHKSTYQEVQLSCEQ